ncbi:MAG: LPP20 family lipoprotein [Halothiobacillaceae bacterium]
MNKQVFKRVFRKTPAMAFFELPKSLGRTLPVVLVSGALALGGCQTMQGGGTAKADRPASVAQQVQIIRAKGQGAGSTDPNLSATQRHLLGMRAARVDAYRNLAEQLRGVRINGSTTIADLAADNDRIRAQVDAFVRGATLVSIDRISGDMFEATLELRIDPAFRAAMLEQVAMSSTDGDRRTAQSSGAFYYAP